ncbi:Gfo/Idh/MocA family protein [Horticoccus sp. 23ND18S-11]|uniref:Gfo/Idh/MocA family protein n=1 Tax=Horticoccus sp. 23ND18S-11 TaxID=3391832 RepID=UPI0039C97E4D
MQAALLGLSHPHSGALLNTLENLSAVRRITLFDSDPLAASRHPALPRSRKANAPTGDLDAALAGSDFAVLCVRHDAAADLAHRVIAAGTHLLAEKPVGITSAEILSVQRAAAKAGVVASVLYPRRAHPCAMAMLSHATAGELGPLLSLEARFLATQVRFRDPRSWLFRRREAGGGILRWLGCHYLDLLQHVSGDEITGVMARLATRSGERIDVEDTAALALEFRSGAIGTFHAGYALAFSGRGYLNPTGYDAHLAITGRAGRIVWPDLAPRLHVELPARARSRTFQVKATNSYAGSYGDRFVRQFVAAIRGQRQPPATLADALRTARVIEAAESSAQTGRFTRVI